MPTLDERLRALLNTEGYDPGELVALGRPAFERVLLALERKVMLTIPGRSSELDGRAYEDGLQAGIAAFAADDMAGVLAELVARKWPDERIALSGVARVKDARVVPFLETALASKEPYTRRCAVGFLGVQRDARAVAALIGALSDRSSDVRGAAVDALGESGDPRAVEPLEALAARSARSPFLAERARQAIRKIRRRR
ncbi:MAG TPA: HEAT repeat domain-containing protein [Polyangiaceae bacterium]